MSLPTAALVNSEQWLRRFHPAPDRPAGRLVCLPHAGGSASYYFPFPQALTGDVEVVAVQYPGRQERLREPPVPDVRHLAACVVAALTAAGRGTDRRPLTLFGHSMGALIAYEAACELRSIGVPVRSLFVSGFPAPSRSGERHLHEWDDEALVAELRMMGGTDDALLADPDVLRLTLPALRADLRAVQAYRHEPYARLTCPIVTLRGQRSPAGTRPGRCLGRPHHGITRAARHLRWAPLRFLAITEGCCHRPTAQPPGHLRSLTPGRSGSVRCRRPTRRQINENRERSP